jgi:YbbR domain-containing protein
MPIVRWFWDNKGTLLLAFILALTVWVAVVSADDPTLEKPMDEFIPINYTEPREGLQLVGQLPQVARLTIRAPESVWEDVSSETIQVNIDLSSLEAGTYVITLEPVHQLRPLRITKIEPATITVTLDPILTKEIPIVVNVVGSPALGYDAQEAVFSPSEAAVVGPASVVSQVVELQAEVEITGERQDVEQELALSAVAENDLLLTDVQIEPGTINVYIAIEQSDRYKLVSVIPKIEGSPAYGYRYMSIMTIPDLIQVTSSDPDAIAEMAGYVFTESIDITDATETVERRVLLDLPEGFTIVGSQTILVKVMIEPIETSITFNLPVEIQGLATDLAAKTTPESVIVTLTGPLSILEQFQPEDVRVVVNLVDLEIGSYVVTPEVVVSQVEVEAEILPLTIEVEITVAPPSTSVPDS